MIDLFFTILGFILIIILAIGLVVLVVYGLCMAAYSLLLAGAMFVGLIIGITQKIKSWLKKA